MAKPPKLPARQLEAMKSGKRDWLTLEFGLYEKAGLDPDLGIAEVAVLAWLIGQRKWNKPIFHPKHPEFIMCKRQLIVSSLPRVFVPKLAVRTKLNTASRILKKLEDARAIEILHGNTNIFHVRILPEFLNSKSRDTEIVPPETQKSCLSYIGRDDRKEESIEELRSSPRTKTQASWSEEAGFEIPDSLILKFQEAYPACDILGQAKRAHMWLTSNPKRAKRKSYHNFLVRWLARAQERGGDLAIEARRQAAASVGSRWQGRDMTPGVLPRQPRYAEPEGDWRAFYGEVTEGEMEIPATWNGVAPAVQQYIVDELKKRQELKE
jgi:hypothetical protein